MTAGQPMPPDTTRVLVCERMGWTLDYYDSLPIDEVDRMLGVWDGVDKAQPKKGKKH